MTVGTMSLEAAAQAAAGNWQRFPNFISYRHLDDDWCLVFTHHRDSSLLDRSNAASITAALKPFMDGDVRPECHGHWMVGWLEGFAIRVYREGEITEAFAAYHDLAQQLADYPILDEEDFSRREYEATAGS